MLDQLLIAANGLAIGLGYLVLGVLPVVAFSILMRRKP
jgi:hypothetical protein